MTWTAPWGTRLTWTASWGSWPAAPALLWAINSEFQCPHQEVSQTLSPLPPPTLLSWWPVCPGFSASPGPLVPHVHTEPPAVHTIWSTPRVLGFQHLGREDFLGQACRVFEDTAWGSDLGVGTDHRRPGGRLLPVLWSQMSGGPPRTPADQCHWLWNRGQVQSADRMQLPSPPDQGDAPCP